MLGAPVALSLSRLEGYRQQYLIARLGSVFARRTSAGTEGGVRRVRGHALRAETEADRYSVNVRGMCAGSRVTIS